jgi:hypothetical protein
LVLFGVPGGIVSQEISRHWKKAGAIVKKYHGYPIYLGFSGWGNHHYLYEGLREMATVIAAGICAFLNDEQSPVVNVEVQAISERQRAAELFALAVIQCDGDTFEVNPFHWQRLSRDEKLLLAAEIYQWSVEEPSAGKKSLVEQLVKMMGDGEDVDKVDEGKEKEVDPAALDSERVAELADVVALRAAGSN